MSKLSLSDAGFNMICELEGVHVRSYWDGPSPEGGPVGKWAAGIGHNSTELYPVEKDTSYSMDQIMEWFTYDSSYWTSYVNRQLPDNATQNMFDALLSLCYNSGALSGNLRTLIKNNAFDPNIATVWKSYKITQAGKVLKGLISRRTREANLYFSNIPYQSSQGIPTYTENTITSITSGTNPSHNVLSTNSLSISSAQTSNTTPPRIYQEFGPTIILDELSMPMDPVNMQNDTQANQTQTTLT